MLSQKIFENLHSMMAILVLFEQVLRQIVSYLNFFALNFEVFTKYLHDAIFRTFLISVYRYKAYKLLLSKRFENGKIAFIKSIVEKGPPPLDPPLTHLVTVGTEIAASHKQQVTVAAVQLHFH